MIRLRSWCVLALVPLVLVAPLHGQEPPTVADVAALLEAGRLDEVRLAAARARAAGDSATARQLLGRVALLAGDFETAQDHLERAVELAPASADYRYWLATAYLADLQQASIFRQRGLASRMRQSLLVALELDPAHVAARSDLVEYYLQAPGIAGGSTEEALRHATELVTFDRRAGYLLTARVHVARDDHEMADLWFEAAARDFRNDADVLYQAGMYHQGQERWERAYSAFETAAALPVDGDNRPWVRSALYQVGRTGALSGTRTERAVEALLEFNRRFAEPVDALTAGAHWRLGILYERLGQTDDAREAYRDALEIDPDHEEASKALRRLGSLPPI